MLTNVDKLTGATVVTKDGRQLGTVSGLDIDTDGWHVTSLAVRLDRGATEDLGMSRKLFGSQTVHISVEHVTGARDSVVLGTTLEQLTREREVKIRDAEAKATAKRVEA